MSWTVANLAARIGGVVEGDGDREVRALSGLSEAVAGDLSFLANPRYEHLMAHTSATAVVVASAWQGSWSSAALIRIVNPDKAFAVLSALFAPAPVVRTPGIHPTAIIAPTAVLGKDVHVGAYTVIDDGARIGDRSVIESQCFIGRDVVVGCDGHLYPQVCLREGCCIGDRFIAHCGAVVGSDGFGFNVEMKDGRPVVVKIPQIGIVEIGHDVELGANTTIDRARFGRTRIGNHVKIDNLVQIGHNVQIGDLSGIAALSGIAGSSQIGSGVMVWAQGGVAGHLKIGDRAQIGAQAGIVKDVPPGEFMLGSPALPRKEFVKLMAAPRAIEKLKAHITSLEARLAALEQPPATARK